MSDADVLAALEDARVMVEAAEEQRARAVVEALDAGWSLGRIAEAAGVSVGSVRGIVDRQGSTQ